MTALEQGEKAGDPPKMSDSAGSIAHDCFDQGATIGCSEDDPTRHIGHNLRRLRTKRGLSMERLAKLSSVSRAMLSQIELAQSVPTIGVLWRVAKALGVPFSALIDQPKTDRDCVVLRRSETRVLQSPDRGCSSRSLHPLDQPHQIEFFELELESCREQVAEAHAVGAKEYLVVAEGCVEVKAKGQSHLLRKGDAMVFVADQPHGYRNAGDSPALMYVVMAYANPLG